MFIAADGAGRAFVIPDDISSAGETLGLQSRLVSQHVSDHISTLDNFLLL